MTTVVWKYPLEVTGRQIIELPTGFAFLSLQMQDGVPTLWALVNPKKEKQKLAIRMTGTGTMQTDNFTLYKYLGSVQEGVYVWHYFAE